MLPVCDFLSFQPKKRLTCFVWELPASHQKNPVHCQPVRFCHPKSQDPQWKTFAEGVALPYQKNKPIVTRWHEPFCTAQHKFQSVGNIAYMSTFPDLRPFADILPVCCDFAPVLQWKLSGIFFSIFIYWCRMWKPRLHSTSGWQLVQQKNTLSISIRIIICWCKKHVSKRVASNCGDEWLKWTEINQFGKAGHLVSFFWDLPVWQKCVSNFQKSKK